MAFRVCPVPCPLGGGLSYLSSTFSLVARAPATPALGNGHGSGLRRTGNLSLWLLEEKKDRGHCYKALEARQPGLGQGAKPRGAGLAPWPLDTFASTGTRINSEF